MKLQASCLLTKYLCLNIQETEGGIRLHKTSLINFHNYQIPIYHNNILQSGQTKHRQHNKNMPSKVWSTLYIGHLRTMITATLVMTIQIHIHTLHMQLRTDIIQLQSPKVNSFYTYMLTPCATLTYTHAHTHCTSYNNNDNTYDNTQGVIHYPKCL